MLSFCHDDDNKAGPSTSYFICYFCHRPIDEHLMEDNDRCSVYNAKRQQQSSAVNATNFIDVSPEDVGNIVPILLAPVSTESTKFIECRISDMTPMGKRLNSDTNKARRSRKRCNYCFRDCELVSLKPYCVKYAKGARECTVCRRPLPVHLVDEAFATPARKNSIVTINKVWEEQKVLST